MSVELTDKERKHYKDLAAVVAKTHPKDLATLNAQAKLALKSVTKGLPEDVSDEIVFTFMASVDVMMAQLMVVPLTQAAEMIETVFDSYALACASLAGEYDLESTADSQESKDLEALFDELVNAREQSKAASVADPNANTGFYL